MSKQSRIASPWPRGQRAKPGPLRKAPLTVEQVRALEEQSTVDRQRTVESKRLAGVKPKRRRPLRKALPVVPFNEVRERARARRSKARAKLRARGVRRSR